MSYLPLARKYRPQTFADLVGQPHVTTTLTRALESQRIAQAYLFVGSRGVGKTSAARILAKCLNCETGLTAKPCQRCASCTQITQGNSFDVVEIDGASNRGIDEIRALRDGVGYAPTTGQFRVYIIDEVHMLTTEAFNALLKTLEEPPAHVKFIFATTAPAKVPATILSRCQRFDFRRLEPSVIVQTLAHVAKSESVAADEAALFAIARAAEGSLRDAEVVLDQLSSFVKGRIREADVTELLGAMESEALAAWAQAILQHRAAAALETLQAQLELGKEPLQLLTGLLRQIRNLLIIASTKDANARQTLWERLIDEPSDRLATLQAQAGESSPQELACILQVLSGAYELIRRSPMAQTILELIVIKLCTREQWQSLGEISQRLEQLSAGATSWPAASPLPTAGAVAPPARAPQAQAAQTTASAPSVEPLAAGAAASEELAGIWAVFLERLGKQKMSLAAYLSDARPMAKQGSTLTVGLPAFALHQEVLNVMENRRLIERLLSELLQSPVSVEYATLPAADTSAPKPPSAAASVPPVVQDIVQLFNATVMDRPR